MVPLKRIFGFSLSMVMATAVLGQATAGPVTGKSRAEWKKEYVRPAETPFPEDNPYSKPKAELGHKLFFDPRLSGNNYISCGTCHNPSFAWGDGLPKGIGNAMTVLGRRTPTILNLAWADSLMWDGRFDTLEEQALGPMAAAVEMNQQMDQVVGELQEVPEYRALFNISFPGSGITIENIAKAIATYERTVVSGVAPFDRWIAGDEDAISVSAKRGFDLFNGKANCVACHSGWNFTDGSFHDIGLGDKDIGRGKKLPGVKMMQHAFKTPTLRNVVERAPYMHDGTLKNLYSVVRHYNDAGVSRPSRSQKIFPLKLTDAEMDDLVSFMKTLSSDDTHVVLPRLPAVDQSLAGSIKGVAPAAGGGQAVPSKSAKTCGGGFMHWVSCNQ
jgi:cytochrome c peroxidase